MIGDSIIVEVVTEIDPEVAGQFLDVLAGFAVGFSVAVAVTLAVFPAAPAANRNPVVFSGRYRTEASASPGLTEDGAAEAIVAVRKLVVSRGLSLPRVESLVREKEKIKY